MRKIKYKSAGHDEFKNYVDIGSCERDYYAINFYVEGDHEMVSGKVYFENYELWFKNFELEAIGSKMIIINFYLSEYMGWSLSQDTPQINYFKDVYGDKTCNVITQNLKRLLEFNETWFYEQTAIFKGLDLDMEYNDEMIIRTVENDDNIITEIEFDDGSAVIVDGENDSLNSFFVEEKDYLYLKNESDFVTNLFRPS